MRASRSISDRILHWQVATLNRARTLGQRVRKFSEDELGQTPTEYLMIVGLMAAVIVLVFVTFYWDQVKKSAQDWVAAVKDAIVGKNIKK